MSLANLDKRIFIAIDSQAALNALGSCEMSSEPVAECIRKVKTIAEYNRVTLIWVPEHSQVTGN